mgnify:CR=1 FL=1
MKIAVIDDERPARKELVHQIMDAMPDSQIEEADSGASAIELISRRTFDLLFVDISLGDMMAPLWRLPPGGFSPMPRLCLPPPTPSMESRPLSWA